MEHCETCAFWKRWGRHTEIEEQNRWGTCEKLTHNDTVSLECHPEGKRECEAETRENFGCILHEQVF